MGIRGTFIDIDHLDAEFEQCVLNREEAFILWVDKRELHNEAKAKYVVSRILNDATQFGYIVTSLPASLRHSKNRQTQNEPTSTRLRRSLDQHQERTAANRQHLSHIRAIA